MIFLTCNQEKQVLFIVNVLVVLLVISSSTANASDKHSRSLSGRLLKLPISAAGCCTGFVVGIPVCFVKKLGAETDYGAHSIVDGLTQADENSKSKKLLLYPVTLLWLPVATITSLVEAPCYSFKNAVSSDKPFNKEQFSLNDFDLSG